MKIIMYTDGACSGNPGPGGWGAILISGKHRKELFGGEAETTNNRMEMMAVIKALEALSRSCTIVITTDSQYVKNGMTQWLAGWKAKGWKTANRKPVKNQDLWQQLDRLVAEHHVTWKWVKGHSGHDENERVDQLANRGIDEM